MTATLTRNKPWRGRPGIHYNSLPDVHRMHSVSRYSQMSARRPGTYPVDHVPENPCQLACDSAPRRDLADVRRAARGRMAIQAPARGLAVVHVPTGTAAFKADITYAGPLPAVWPRRNATLAPPGSGVRLPSLLRYAPLTSTTCPTYVRGVQVSRMALNMLFIPPRPTVNTISYSPAAARQLSTSRPCRAANSHAVGGGIAVGRYANAAADGHLVQRNSGPSLESIVELRYRAALAPKSSRIRYSSAALMHPRRALHFVPHGVAPRGGQPEGAGGEHPVSGGGSVQTGYARRVPSGIRTAPPPEGGGVAAQRREPVPSLGIGWPGGHAFVGSGRTGCRVRNRHRGPPRPHTLGRKVADARHHRLHGCLPGVHTGEDVGAVHQRANLCD